MIETSRHKGLFEYSVQLYYLLTYLCIVVCMLYAWCMVVQSDQYHINWTIGLIIYYTIRIHSGEYHSQGLDFHPSDTSELFTRAMHACIFSYSEKIPLVYICMYVKGCGKNRQI